VRQKNTSGYTLRSADYGGEIGPGEEIDHPDLITGCEPARAVKAAAKADAKASADDKPDGGAA
jgi:hypothetical protein